MKYLAEASTAMLFSADYLGTDIAKAQAANEHQPPWQPMIHGKRKKTFDGTVKPDVDVFGLKAATYEYNELGKNTMS